MNPRWVVGFVKNVNEDGSSRQLMVGERRSEDEVLHAINRLPEAVLSLNHFTPS